MAFLLLHNYTDFIRTPVRTPTKWVPTGTTRGIRLLIPRKMLTQKTSIFGKESVPYRERREISGGVVFWLAHGRRGIGNWGLLAQTTG